MPDGLHTPIIIPATSAHSPFSIAGMGAELSRLHAVQDELGVTGAPTLRGATPYEAIGRSIHALEQAILLSRAETLPDVLTQLCVAQAYIDTFADGSREDRPGDFITALTHGYKNVLQRAVLLLSQHTGTTVCEAAGACYVPAGLDYWTDSDASRGGQAIDGSGARA